MPSHRQPPPPAPELTVTIEVEPSTDEPDQLAGRDGPLVPVPAWLVRLWQRLRPLWRARGAALLLAVIVAGAFLARPGQAPTVPGSATLGAVPSATGGTAAARAAYRTLVVPGSAQAGQTLTLIGYQRRGVCDATAVYLDLRPVGHEVVAVVDAALPDWDGIVLAVRLPDDVSRGSHVVSLVGALPGPGRGADICAESRQHTGVLASAVLQVEPAG